MNKLLLLLLFSTITVAQNKIEVFFDFNSDVPNVNSTQFFNRWMNENQDVEVVKISGYCVSVDQSSYNKDLGLRRINSVLENLKGSKIKINPNLIIENMGKDFKQSKIQAENRKVVVFYQKIKEEKQLANQIKKSKKGDLIKLENIYFYNNSAQIVSKSEATLYQLLKIMRDNPKLKIEIQGHICCKMPTDPEEVSNARAKAIYDYLVQREIKKDRLTYKGYGVSRPVHPIPEKNTQEEDENRRVEIMILEN